MLLWRSSAQIALHRRFLPQCNVTPMTQYASSKPRQRAAAMPRVGFVSLGCPKALVDSEQILTRLRAEGYAIAPTYDGADLVVVNTAGLSSRRCRNRWKRSARRSRKTAA